jgi:hypothetical protein
MGGSCRRAQRGWPEPTYVSCCECKEKPGQKQVNQSGGTSRPIITGLGPGGSNIGREMYPLKLMAEPFYRLKLFQGALLSYGPI